MLVIKLSVLHTTQHVHQTLLSAVTLTCSCGEESEGKLWDDLLRGGGCGGVSKFGWGPEGGIGAAMGTSGSCNF